MTAFDRALVVLVRVGLPPDTHRMPPLLQASDPTPGSALGQPPAAGSKGATELDKLIKESEEAIQRLERLERGGQGVPLGARISGHLRRHGSTLINIGLAASVLAVAMGRLGQKYEFQASDRSRGWEIFVVASAR